MKPHRVPTSEWRKTSEAEQVAVIRAGYTPLDQLPPEVRAEVDEMLAAVPGARP